MKANLTATALPEGMQAVGTGFTSFENVAESSFD